MTMTPLLCIICTREADYTQGLAQLPICERCVNRYLCTDDDTPCRHCGHTVYAHLLIPGPGIPEISIFLDCENCDCETFSRNEEFDRDLYPVRQLVIAHGTQLGIEGQRVAHALHDVLEMIDTVETDDQMEETLRRFFAEAGAPDGYGADIVRRMRENGE